MLRGTIVLVSSVIYSMVNYIICMYFTDNIYTTIVRYCPVSPSSPLYPVYSMLDYICWIILFISIEAAGLAIVYFYLRIINKEREEFVLYQ